MELDSCRNTGCEKKGDTHCKADQEEDYGQRHKTSSNKSEGVVAAHGLDVRRRSGAADNKSARSHVRALS